MSVPENARTKGKLEACVKAHDLACYTLQIATNKKNFPEQFQTALTDKIVSVALDIHTLAWSANNVLVNSPEDLAERLGFQERAAIARNILLSMIEVAHRVFHLPTKRVVYWSGKAIETRNLIRAWRESDRKRYSDKFKK